MPFGSLSNTLEIKNAEGFRGSCVLQQSYPLTGYTVGAAPAPAFTPLSLFSGGVQGVWYDPSDLTTMFEDSAGTAPVHTPGNGVADSPVGKIMDKSGNANHATQSTSTAKPTLSARYNILVATDTLSTQSVTTVASTYTLSFSGAGTITLTGTKTGVYTSGTNTLTGVTAGTLTLTVAGSVTNADLRVSNDGVGLPAYQRVVDANTYDSTGFPYYLKSDGVDDYLRSSSVDLSSTNKATIFVGYRQLDNYPGTKTIIEQWFGSAGGVALWNNSANYLTAFSKGSAQATVNSSVFHNAPSTQIVTSSADIAAPSVNIRENGTQTGVSTATQGTGNYSNSYVDVFARGGLYSMNGRGYGFIIRGAASTATEISNTETWLNGKTKAY